VDEREGRVRILLMDSHPESLHFLGKSLWDGGYDLSFVSSPDLLRKRLRILSFDLILVNAGAFSDSLPEILEAIRTSGNRPPVPVIALVPENQISRVEGWLGLGLSDYLPLPVPAPGILLSRIATHLRIRQEMDGLEFRIRELEKSNRNKDRFYSILSHDLKAPFQGLVGLLELLHGEYETLTPREVREYIRNIHDSTKRTYRLLENLLEWSGLQAGQLPWTPQEINLKLLLEDTMGLFAIGARDKGISLSCQVDPEIRVFADLRMLASVIRNLIYNGIKYTDQGGAITVKVRESVEYYEIVVEDTGVGIEPERLQLILREGEMLSTPGTAQESGSGLGLKLCRHFVEKNGGQFWVRSHPGEGSRFVISLPKKSPEFSRP